MDFSRADVAHLLRRSGFASPPSAVDALVTLPSWAAVVDRVLDTSANPPDTIPAAVDQDLVSYYLPWVAGVTYWMDRMVTTPTPIVEKMTLFWHGLFTSSLRRSSSRLMVRQIKTYRRLGLGDLHELAQAMAIDPAMLLFLDNRTNVVGNPNENFGRELMELFLLGRDQYDEDDVIEMARAWTGHGYNSRTETYEWQPARHDSGMKTIFGIRRAWDGPQTITEMVRGSRQRSCARHIARRLWAFLAGPTPSATTLETLTDAFVASGMNIKALVRAVFLHPDFRAPATRTGLVRSPAEWMVATMQCLGLRSDVLHPEQYLQRCGQKLYQVPNVGGWSTNEGWISTSTAWGQGHFATFARWQAVDAGVFAGYDSLPPDQAVQGAFDRFGVDDPSPVTREVLERYVASELAARRGFTIAPGLVTMLMLSSDFHMA